MKCGSGLTPKVYQSHEKHNLASIQCNLQLEREKPFV